MVTLSTEYSLLLSAWGVVGFCTHTCVVKGPGPGVLCTEEQRAGEVSTEPLPAPLGGPLKQTGPLTRGPIKAFPRVIAVDRDIKL